MTNPPDLEGLPLAWEAITPEFGVYRLADPDALLEAPAVGEDPYHATLWPSGEALALALVAEGLPAPGAVVDLGCGPGPAGLAAALAGHEVTFVDRAPRALDLVWASARRLGIAPPVCRCADWETFSPPTRVPWVLAADVVYDPIGIPALLACLDRCLAPEGEVWLADPGRPGLDVLCEALSGSPFRVLAEDELPPTRAQVSVRRLRLGR